MAIPTPEQSDSASEKTLGVDEKTLGIDENTLEEFELPGRLRKQLEELGGRTDKEKFREVILALCQWKQLAAEELARLTNRTKKYLVRTHLTPLLEAGKLEYTIPEMPNHPDQAYRTASG